MLAIGGGDAEAKLFDLVAGFSVFPNNGYKIEPTPFAAIYQNGRSIDLHRAEPVQVIGAAPAYVTTQMMRSVVRDGGTGSGTLPMAGLPADASIAAKTGSGQVSDLTFIGFSPRIIVGVWVGMPDNIPALTMIDGFSGSRSAMPIWAAFIKALNDSGSDLCQGQFKRPPGVNLLHIDSQFGCLSNTGEEEYFVEGREPARCYQR
jgi:penicillin-binding protein 1A